MHIFMCLICPYVYNYLQMYLQGLNLFLSSLQKKAVSGSSEENVTVIFLFLTSKFLVKLQGGPEINMQMQFHFVRVCVVCACAHVHVCVCVCVCVCMCMCVFVCVIIIICSMYVATNSLVLK